MPETVLRTSYVLTSLIPTTIVQDRFIISIPIYEMKTEKQRFSDLVKVTWLI